MHKFLFHYKFIKCLYMFRALCAHHSFIHSSSALEAGLAGTRAQSCDRYGSGTLHPGQVLGGSLPLLSPNVLIIRSKLYYTASGIVTPVGGCPVHRLRDDSLNLCTGRPPTGVMIPDAVYYNFDLLMMSTTVLETCRGI